MDKIEEFLGTIDNPHIKIMKHKNREVVEYGMEFQLRCTIFHFEEEK